MAPVDTIKAILQVGFDVAKGVEAAKANGILNLTSDLAILLPLIQEVPGVLANIAAAPKSLSELTDADMVTLNALGEAQFPALVGDPALCTKIEKAYQVGLAVAELIAVL